MPNRYRRIILALRYLQYLLKLPAHHYARATFDDACLLHAEKKPSRVGDVVSVGLLCCAAVSLLHALCARCATSVADETVEVSSTHPGLR
jgi:hypothetical protein